MHWVCAFFLRIVRQEYGKILVCVSVYQLCKRIIAAGRYANASLLLGEDTLEYAFWRVGPQEPAAYSSKRAVYREEDKFVYRIRKTDIHSIDVKGDICRIEGSGIVQMPEWAEEDATVKRESKTFSFIMAFEQRNAEQILAEWMK